MNDLIHDELKALLAKWKNGETIRGIALGHTIRVVEKDGEKSEQPHIFRQRPTYELVFRLIDRVLTLDPLDSSVATGDFEVVKGVPADATVAVQLDHRAIEQIAREEAENLELSPGEQIAAISLAWVALRIGWERAIANYPMHHYITLQRPAVTA